MLEQRPSLDTFAEWTPPDPTNLFPKTLPANMYGSPARKVVVDHTVVNNAKQTKRDSRGRIIRGI